MYNYICIMQICLNIHIINVYSDMYIIIYINWFDKICIYIKDRTEKGAVILCSEFQDKQIISQRSFRGWLLILHLGMKTKFWIKYMESKYVQSFTIKNIFIRYRVEFKPQCMKKSSFTVLFYLRYEHVLFIFLV